MKKPAISQIEATAEAIKSNFIPKDQEAKNFSFYFTIPPSSNYKVNYEKDARGDWKFVDFEEDKSV